MGVLPGDGIGQPSRTPHRSAVMNAGNITQNAPDWTPASFGLFCRLVSGASIQARGAGTRGLPVVS